MASSATSLRSNLAPAYLRSSKISSVSLIERDKRLAFISSSNKKRGNLQIITSVLRNRSSISDNGDSDSARALLERLFVQTQKLEEQMIGNSHPSEDINLVFDLSTLESDLLSALEVLKEKEKDLHEAERAVLLEQAELNRSKDEFEQRKKFILVACSKQEKLEEEVRLANLKLISQANEIEDLKLRTKERGQEIAILQFALSSKEEELDKVRDQLARKTEELDTAETELKLKAQILNNTEEIVKRQKTELLELQNMLHDKEKDLEIAMKQCKLEEDKVKAAEAMLSNQAMEWLSAQEELKKLREEASRNIEENNLMMKEFQRVKILLTDVRSELVSSQKSLALSRHQMEERDRLLEKQLLGLEEQRKSITAHMASLKEAQIEVESERSKLRLAEARNKELEEHLSKERKLVNNLQIELGREEAALQETNKEVSLLQEQLKKKDTELEETRSLLELRESELAEAKLGIQLLKSETTSLQLALNGRDFELYSAKTRLEEVNVEVEELKTLMKSKEDQLIQATSLLKEKEDHAEAMQSELNITMVKCNEAERVVERILNLTNELVVSVKENNRSSMSSQHIVMGSKSGSVYEKPDEDYGWAKEQLEVELNLGRENLKIKELELLAMERSLKIKEEELKTVLLKLEEREEKLRREREEVHRDAEDLKKLYAIAHERINGRTVADLAIEKLQLEASRLEVEAATSALDKLVTMSRELLHEDIIGIEADIRTNIYFESGAGPVNLGKNNDAMINNCDGAMIKFSDGVARLSVLTEQLVQEAGVLWS